MADVERFEEGRMNSILRIHNPRKTFHTEFIDLTSIGFPSIV